MFRTGFWIRIRIGSGFNRASGSGIRIQEGKNDPEKVEFFFKFMFWSVGWPLLWAAGFFCNLDILYGGLGIGKLQFLIIKKFNFFPAVIFFNFWSLKPWIRIGSGSWLVSSLKRWIRIRIKWIRIRNPGFGSILVSLRIRIQVFSVTVLHFPFLF